MTLADREVLTAKGLNVWLSTVGGPLHVVRDISLSVRAGECVALVGESGSGKSVTARALLGLLPTERSRVEGTVRVADAGSDLIAASERTRTRIRRRSLAMISQDPMTALDPVARIGDQLRDTIALGKRLRRDQVRQRSLRLLTDVGISDPPRTLAAWPHELSGGMRQRVAIALAIANSPQLLIADEPTTALDVTVQAQVLRMLRGLQNLNDMGLLLITHDMTVVRQAADRVAVMLKGEIVEFGSVTKILEEPEHPYTQGLIGSTLSMSTSKSEPLTTVASYQHSTKKGRV